MKTWQKHNYVLNVIPEFLDAIKCQISFLVARWSLSLIWTPSNEDAITMLRNLPKVIASLTRPSEGYILRNFRKYFSLLALVFLLLPTYQAEANDYYVNATTGSNTTGDGTSGNPWKTITYALDQIAGTSHTVYVSAGTYNITLGETFPILMKNGVSLVGAGIDVSIIDAGGTNTVIRCVSIVDTATRVEGFTIKNGGNVTQGGGIYISAGSLLKIINNKIMNNTCSNGGGGIYISSSSPAIINNTISNNNTGSYSDGGGIYISNASPLILNNNIVNNSGDGLYTTLSSIPRIINNVIAGNTGEGIQCYSSARIINNTISDNMSNGIYIYSASPDSIFNNILSYNSGYGISEYGISSDPGKVYYNLFYQNSQGVYRDEGTTDYYTTIALNSGVTECKNNIQGDPRFIDKSNRNYHEKVGSPAVDAGDPSFAYSNEPSPNGSRINIGAYGNTSQATITGNGGTNLTDYYVNAATGNNTTGDGTSGNPWKTITNAFNQITNTGCTVHVSSGTYDTTLGETFPILMKDGISLIGAGIGTSIIYAPYSGVSVINCIGIIDTTTKIEGFAITGGKAQLGGGLYISAGSTIKILNSKIDGNSATQGGGLYANNSSVIIINDTITNNSINEHWGYGGGLYLTNASATISNNTISNNYGSEAWAIAAGLYLVNSTVTITKNNIINNDPGIFGTVGGIYLDNCSATISNNIIAVNRTYNSAGYVDGSGIYIIDSSPLIEENKFVYNSQAANCIYISGSTSSPRIIHNEISKNTGDAIYCESLSHPKIINNTISDNTGNGIDIYSASPDSIINDIIAYNSNYGIKENNTSSNPGKVWYNLFYSNGSGVYNDGGSTDYYTTSTLNANVPECKNDIEGDPLFVDKVNADYHLRSGSTAIDAGDPNSLVDPDGTRSDIGALYFQQSVSPPSVPTLLSPLNGATGVSLTPKLSWNRASGAATYSIQVSTFANFSTIVFSRTGIVDTSIAIGVVSSNTVYYWQVNAANTGGTSAYSSVFSFTTVPPLSAPKNLTIITGNTQVTLKWNKNTEADFLRYRIYRGTSSGTEVKVDSTTSGITDTTRVEAGLTNGTKYYFRITAVNNTGLESGYSNEVNATPAVPLPPAAPQNLTVITGNTQVTLKWNKNTEADFLRYRIYRGTSSGTELKVDSTTSGITDTTRVEAGLTNGTKYYFRITAVNSAGMESGYSNEVSATPAVPILPAAPQNLTAVAGYGQVSLNWNKNTETDFLKYFIYMGNDSSTIAMSLKDSSSNSLLDTTKLITGLTNGTKYYFRVSALNNTRLESAKSFAVSATPSKPASPISLTATAISESQINLSWSSGGGTVLRYRIYRSTDSLSYSKIDSTAGTSYSDTTLIKQTSYWYKLTALNIMGDESDFSVTVKATTLRPMPRLIALNVQKSPQRGDVKIAFSLHVPAGAIANLAPAYSTDSGKTFSSTANVIGGLTNISTDKSDTIVWKTAIDLPNYESRVVKFRITPSDQWGDGIPDTTDLFTVDNKPPVFGGLHAAMWDTNKVRLRWYGAADVSKPITYAIYSSIISKGENLKQSINSSSDTQLVVTGLPALQHEFFVVRAQDAVGNLDTNTVEDSIVVSPAADFNGNMRVDAQDLSLFIWAWRANNISVADIGPVNGSPPFSAIPHDGKIDLEDLIVFGEMWDWGIAHPNLSMKSSEIRNSHVIQPQQIIAEDSIVIERESSKNIYIGVEGSSDIQTLEFTVQFDPAKMKLDSLNLVQSNSDLLQFKNIDNKNGLGILAVSSLSSSLDSLVSSKDFIKFSIIPLQELSGDSISISVRVFSHLAQMSMYGIKLISLNSKGSIPKQFELSQNYPNPFNPSTKIEYQLPKNAHVLLKIYNILGQEVVTLVDEEQTAGYYKKIWNGTNQAGTIVSSGVYIIRIQTQDFIAAKKMMLIR